MKYLKITLILFGICLVCALATAGVNMFTAPKIAEYKEEQKMAAYLELFPEMSASNSEFINSGFSSSYVKEKCIVKDSNGNNLGYGFQVSGANTYGTITLVVALDNEGNLRSIKATENSQTGGRNTMIDEYIAGFTSGMTAEDVANSDVYAGATYGSNLVKNLLAAAFAEAGIMSPTQELLVGIFGDSVDMGQTVEDTQFIYAQQVKVGYEVKDSAGIVLGYYYEVNVTNKFGNINLGVALNNDYTLKQVEAIEIVQKPYGEVDTNEITSEYVGGMTANSSYDDISNLTPVAGATYSTTSAKVAILVAMKEAQNTFDETLALRIMFNKDYASTSDLEATVDGVDKYQDVLNAEGTSIGKAVTVAGSNDYGNIKLYVGISSSNTLAGIFILENGQTAGRADSLTDFIPQFTTGMTGEEAVGVDGLAGATFASNTAKDLIATAFEQVTGERPTLSYDSYYEQAFEGVDLSKSTDFTGYSGEHIEEAKNLNDANGNLLGYAFILAHTYSVGAGENTGSLTLLVAVNTNGTLAKVIDILNSQSGPATGLLDNYHNNFTAGMTSSDIDVVDNVTGATYGSNAYKALIKEAMSEVANYTTYYEDAFGEDATFEEISSLNRAEIIQGIKALNGETVLGYAYIIRLENVYGYNVVCIALDKDGKFKDAIDVENNHSNLDETMDEYGETVFKPGLSFDDVTNIDYNPTDDPEAHGSYTIETLRLAILIAMDTNGNNLSESVTDELYIKQLFNNAVMTRSVKLDTIVNNPTITKVYQVGGTSNYVDGSVLGYVYFLTVENEDIVMSLVVGVDANHNYVGSIMTNYETKVSINISGSFSDTLQGRVVTYLDSFKGMSDSDIQMTNLPSGMSYAAQLVKYALRLCIAESNAKTFAKLDLYNDSQIYLNAIPNLDVTNIKKVYDEKEFLYSETISGIELIDGSKAFIINRMDVYSHNYVLVYLDADNKLISVYDVENNHGSISGVTNFFPAGMEENDIYDISYNPNNDPEAHSSYTVEMTRLAILIAMAEAKGTATNTTSIEMAIKELFPFAIYTRGEEIEATNTSITFAMQVKGVNNYVAGQNLGQAYVINDILFGVDNLGTYIGYVALKDITGTEEEKFYNSIEVGTTLADIENLTGDETAKNNVLAVLEEARLHSNLTECDNLILEAFPSFVPSESMLKPSDEIYNKEDVLKAVDVKDVNNTTIGYAYIIRLENAYGYNIVCVALDKDGKFVDAMDVENNHSNVDDTMESNKDYFKPGMTAEEISAITWNPGNDPEAHGSFSVETVRLAILIAMQEYNPTTINNSLYESTAKKVFPNMVATRSEVLEKFDDASILFGYKVLGTANYQDGADLGYFLVVTGENTFGVITLGVGIDTEGKLVGISIIENGQTGGRDEQIAEYITQFTTGMTAEEVANVPVHTGATYGSNLVKDLLAKAFSASETLKGGNN